MKHRILLHFGFWSVYIVLNAYISIGLGQSTSEMEYSLWVRFLRSLGSELAVLPLKLIPTYYIFYGLIPSYFYKEKYLLIGIKAFLMLLITVVLHRLAVYYIIVPALYHGDYPNYANFNPARILYTFVDFLSIISLATAIKFWRINSQGRQREQLLIQEKLESELHFLRAQTNPHFLFNTLNNIYALARKDNKQTAKVILKLSQLMRFMLYECTAKRIPITQEIKVIQDYIELEKLRHNHLNLTWKKALDDKNQHIAPLLLLPFVENAFKHGASENRFSTTIDISFLLKSQCFEFIIGNTKSDDTEEISEGIGLSNVKRQLELIYKGQYELNIDHSHEYFSVHLKIFFNDKS